MTHGCISGPIHGRRWENKCGVWLRIQHGLAEMEGGTLYGMVLGFYAKTSRQKNPGIKSMKPAKLTKDDQKYIQTRVLQMSQDLKDRFDRAYQAWQESCRHPLIAIDSNPISRTHTPAFRELISLGPDILPLLMEKLTNPEDFFALQAVDHLLRPEFVVSHDPHDPAILHGEQGRALETVKQWIKTQS
jgi:hypothetical protein